MSKATGTMHIKNETTRRLIQVVANYNGIPFTQVANRMLDDKVREILSSMDWRCYGGTKSEEEE